MISGKPGQVANISANAFMDSLATFRHNCGLPGISLQLSAHDLSKDDTVEWTAMILKAMSVPIACQIVAEPESISTAPSLAQDPVFAHIHSTVPLSTKLKSKLSLDEANERIVNMLRVAMELQATERLGTCHHFEMTSG